MSVLEHYWHHSADEVTNALKADRQGLTAAEAAARLEDDGANRIAGHRGNGTLALLARQFTSPITLLLIGASILSFFLGDAVDGWIILAIVGLSGLLGFSRERRAAGAVQSLMKLVQVDVHVRRDGRVQSVALEDVVPGDVVTLSAGDVIPGDGLILESDALLADEAPLTGEAYPVEKRPGVVPDGAPLGRRSNCLFAGTHVVSGTAEAIVVRTGAATELGRISKRLDTKPSKTGFEQGLDRFGGLIAGVTGVLLVVIFAANLALSRPFIDSLLFSLSLAVGITPQLLPAIVSISLSEGARRMAKAKVIVKRLDAIEDFGSMDVLCTDKTGTLTEGSVRLAGACDIRGADSSRVRDAARLNARLQTGFQNPIDAALVAGAPAEKATATRLGEIPYDFRRKRISVLVAQDGRSVLITKGAVKGVLAACGSAELPDGRRVALADVRKDLDERVEQLADQGYRVLAVARRELGWATHVEPGDETDMTLLGLVSFLDPPKPGVERTLRKLGDLGVSLRLLTGDSGLAAAHLVRAVGLDPGDVVTGEQIGRLDDVALERLVERARVFAEVEPEHKERVIGALRRAGHVVGFMGDGINDAPALHAADVGISVNTAVDVAKESAAIVMLDHGLEPVIDGVRLGRETFVNTQKYAFTTLSASFGNVMSMAVGSLVLPFLPLLPRQVLLESFLTDVPSMTIAGDSVDSESTESPQRWDIAFMRRFMVFFGLISSVFDLVTFVVLRLGFDAPAGLFRTAWFVESAVTELVVLFVLRTRRPFYRSRPGRGLVVSSVAIGILTLALPYTPIAGVLGFTSLSASVLLAMLGITAAYVVASEVGKRVFFSRRTRPDTKGTQMASNIATTPSAG